MTGEAKKELTVEELRELIQCLEGEFLIQAGPGKEGADAGEGPGAGAL